MRICWVQILGVSSFGSGLGYSGGAGAHDTLPRWTSKMNTAGCSAGCCPRQTGFVQKPRHAGLVRTGSRGRTGHTVARLLVAAPGWLKKTSRAARPVSRCFRTRASSPYLSPELGRRVAGIERGANPCDPVPKVVAVSRCTKSGISAFAFEPKLIVNRTKVN